MISTTFVITLLTFQYRGILIPILLFRGQDFRRHKRSDTRINRDALPLNQRPQLLPPAVVDGNAPRRHIPQDGMEVAEVGVVGVEES